MENINQLELDKIVAKTVSDKAVHGAVFHLESAANGFAITSAQGNIMAHDPFYIASINKLFISALTLRLCHENKLKLSDKISKYLSAEDIKGLLVYKGVDYSGDITVHHLISQTSGLPCYLIDKQPDGTINMALILNGNDQSWPFDKVVSEVKKMKAKFKPGSAGKANYSETNFRLLDKILEVVTQQKIGELLTALFAELGMKNTVVLDSEKEQQYIPVYFKQNQLKLSNYWDSTNHDIASTAQDLMLFLKAFFSGKFYPKDKLAELEKWNSIFFPFKYGIGIQKFYIPRILSPFKPVPEIIGHCGSVGSIAFFVPDKAVFITGTVNQTSNRSIVFQTMMKIVNKL